MNKLIGMMFLFCFIFVNQVMAGGFNMTSIGQVGTAGRQITQWWYTSGNPTIRGQAIPGAEVIYDIDGVALQINADSSGDWVFTPQAVLAEGDYSILIKSGGSEIKFTLTK
jgi:hypothetical protein